MPRPSKIRTAGKEARVRELAAQGMTSREIADQLATEGLKINYTAVARFLRSEVRERREAASNVAAGEAQESVALVQRTLRNLIKLGMEHAEATKDPAKFARVSQATTGAARALHSVAMGDSAEDGSEQVIAKVNSLLRRRQAREQDETAGGRD